MTASALFAFLHFVAVFGIFATVFLEWQTMSPAPTLAEATRMQRCDRWYGLFAMLLLVVGFLRVFYFEKGAAYSRGLYHSDSLGGSSAVRLPDKGKSGHWEFLRIP